MNVGLPVTLKKTPPLDPDFIPAVLWNRAYASKGAGDEQRVRLSLALERPDGTVFVHRRQILPHQGANADLNNRYIERFVKFILWQQGGAVLYVAGQDAVAAELQRLYTPSGARAFDRNMIGSKIFDRPVTVKACTEEELPQARAESMPLGRHLDGCRIGFDLGGSDRKCAALIDGKVIYSEEIRWDPYFEKNPQYHIDGINDSLRRAAEKLPRVDAIGGSAAGVYINNEVRLASLFRGVSEQDFETRVRGLFKTLRREWNNIPFDVVNDGEVTALAGAMSLGSNSVLGISMGTSLAAGYCDAEGHITPWLNELAFAPVDYNPKAPADEWSGDIGCGVQYFSQQAVGRLADRAGLALPAAMPLAEKLIEVQQLLAAGDERARRIYETIGVYLGYTVAHYAAFYDIRSLLMLGRVTSGEGGQILMTVAEQVLAEEFPELAAKIRLCMPDEKNKRHGQAVAAASLPVLLLPQ